MSGTIGTITQTVVGTTEVHRVELAIVAGSLNVYGDGASSIGDIDGLQDALDDKQPLDVILSATTAPFTVELYDKLEGIEPGAQVNADPDWDDVQSKPVTFPSAIALVSGLQAELDGKQASLGYTPYNATNPAGYTTNTGTVTAVTVAAANGFTASVANQGATPALTISQQDATASQAGKLSAADWSTFNAKAVAPYLKNIVLWTHSTATNGNMLGSTLTGNGSFGPAVPTAAGSIWAGMARSLYANVVTTLNQVLGVRTGESIFHVGSVAGKGGFTYRARLGMEVWNNSGRFFAGICAGTSLVVTANPSTNNNSCGFCVDDNDSGLISFVTRNGTTTTKTSTGKTMVSGAAFDIEIIVAPNGATAAWSIREINTLANTAATGTASATLPDNTTMMGACVLASNAALATATAVQIGVVTIYVQTDY